MYASSIAVATSRASPMLSNNTLVLKPHQKPIKRTKHFAASPPDETVQTARCQLIKDKTTRKAHGHLKQSLYGCSRTP